MTLVTKKTCDACFLSEIKPVLVNKFIELCSSAQISMGIGWLCLHTKSSLEETSNSYVVLCQATFSLFLLEKLNTNSSDVSVNATHSQSVKTTMWPPRAKILQIPQGQTEWCQPVGRDSFSYSLMPQKSWTWLAGRSSPGWTFLRLPRPPAPPSPEQEPQEWAHRRKDGRVNMHG